MNKDFIDITAYVIIIEPVFNHKNIININQQEQYFQLYDNAQALLHGTDAYTWIDVSVSVVTEMPENGKWHRHFHARHV